MTINLLSSPPLIFLIYQGKYFWDGEDDVLVKTIWRTKCRVHIGQAFADAKRYGRKPHFISLDWWEEMKKEWANDPVYQKRSATNKKKPSFRYRSWNRNLLWRL